VEVKKPTDEAPQQPPGDPLLIHCIFCKQDMTEACYMIIQPNAPPLVLQPGRCPHCKMPMCYIRAGSPILVPQGAAPKIRQ